MPIQFRLLTITDQPILWEMLRYAAQEPSVEAVKEQPLLRKYVEQFGRSGDCGIVAMLKEQAIGAAWLRLWSEQERGLSYLDNQTPELAMAVLPDYRQQGVGTQLLSHLIELATPQFPAISLSVRAENPAIALYERFGFGKIPNSEIKNRVGDISFLMKRPLSSKDIKQ
ncbi:GNAT family N-acetyltransferase [Synechococcus elongatus]|uniref:GNAT family N-acetyltransferase n=1 Tax=Synechococcus elongatus PCC 11802 TaxID=2283154 RepID=A0AAT9JXY4_SYNEL|nr:GNAT family N-acetyltransferase [Synechococcus elongatus]QFZ91588.1 GNAT family N-acetyltransferase [Synechococcus elongatus PCC 11802]